MADDPGIHDWMDFSAKRLTVENPQLVLEMLGIPATIDASEETATEQRAQRALTRRDLVMKLNWRGVGEVFLLIEFIGNAGADDHARMGPYIDDSHAQGHHPSRPAFCRSTHCCCTAKRARRWNRKFAAAST